MQVSKDAIQKVKNHISVETGKKISDKTAAIISGIWERGVIEVQFDDNLVDQIAKLELEQLNGELGIVFMMTDRKSLGYVIDDNNVEEVRF